MTMTTKKKKKKEEEEELCNNNMECNYTGITNKNPIIT